MNAEFISAIQELEDEKGISKDILIEAVELALVKAYKKNFVEKYSNDFDMNSKQKKPVAESGNVEVSIDRETGDIKVYSKRTVVNKREIDLLDGEISLEGAQEIDTKYEIGDVVKEEVTPGNFGRIATQTARQVVIQKITEASRDIVYNEFMTKESEIMIGEIIRKSKNNNCHINLSLISERGNTIYTEATLLNQEQIPGEEYNVGDRIIVYILEVKKHNNVPQIIVSRSHPGLVKRLFEREVPEISEGIVQIKSIAREAGSRTKLSVHSVDEAVDAIGACVGTKGVRVANIVEELKGEKIDIVNYSDDPIVYISNALSPSKVVEVSVNEEEKSTKVIVPDYQLSLAIGKEGQNARLAAKLTGWKIDIKSESQALEEDDDIFDEDIMESMEDASNWIIPQEGSEF
ncbi:transcription termination factor NusA [Filifactor villosus]|uniref:Transcription termination/antitermination protein NusA n=1 Tax=Filifactor villosus TaxID=29374 RepID=A0ABV9QK33_9FIRM